MYRRILVPLDGSRFAEAALPPALTLSRRAEAAVHLVTIREPLPSFARDVWEAEATEWAREYLADVVERIGARAGGEVTTALRTGAVVDRLQEEARDVEADLVVMATHGRGALSRAWLGSVADGFVRNARRPVLVVRPEEEQPEHVGVEAGVSRILVPLDGSEAAEEALEPARAVGALFDAGYRLVRVVPRPLARSRPYLPHTLPPGGEELETARREEAESYLASVAEGMRGHGLDVETSVTVAAQPAHAILTAAEETGCDLVVMATHARTGLSRALLGSTADKVLRGTRVPVLLHRRGE